MLSEYFTLIKMFTAVINRRRRVPAVHLCAVTLRKGIPYKNAWLLPLSVGSTIGSVAINRIDSFVHGTATTFS